MLEKVLQRGEVSVAFLEDIRYRKDLSPAFLLPSRHKNAWDAGGRGVVCFRLSSLGLEKVGVTSPVCCVVCLWAEFPARKSLPGMNMEHKTQ